MADDLFKTLTQPKVLLLIAGVIFVLNLWGFQDKVMDVIGGDSDAPSGMPVTKCYHDGATMTIGPMQQAWYPAADVSVAYARVFVSGVDQGLKADGSTLEVTPGEDIEIYYAENQSGTFGQPFWYTAKQKFTVPCKSDFTTGDNTLDNDAFKLYNSTQEDSTNLSNSDADGTGGQTKCFSQDDGTIVTQAAPENLQAGDDITLSCQIDGIYREAFSPYGKPADCLQYNASLYDVVEVVGASKVATPSYMTGQIGAGMTVQCYELPFNIKSSEVYKYSLHIETSDVFTWEVSNITQMFQDQDYYQDSVDGSMQMGYEDKDGNELGTKTPFIHLLAMLN